MRITFKRVNVIVLLTLMVTGILFQCTEDELITPKPTSDTEARAVISPSDCSMCTYVVPATAGIVDGAALGIKPGSVICLSAAIKYLKSITFKNLTGTVDKPIIVTNCGGQANLTVVGRPYNVKFSNSKYFRVTGGSATKSYGIKISGSTSCGLVLCELSTNFEVDHVEVFNVGFAGIMAKTDPTCDDATIRGNFTMRDVKFHDNYIHDTGGEGFYVGHSYYSGYTTSTCGVRLPHLIENAKIYKNLVRRSGWDGIQLSCASLGAEVYGNTVENYALKNNPAQNCGIVLGAGTGGTCYSNYIKIGTGPGITAFGLADNLIHDNIIISAGTIGIFCDERTDPGSGFKIVNNTIISPKGEGMRIYADKVPSNLIINNIIANPGSYNKYTTNSYIMKLSGVTLDMSNNITTRYVTDLKFVNAAGYNFRLTSTSPAIDKGRSISSYLIPKDFYSANRLKGSFYDIGASEYY
jgi:hypothetical protein